MTDISNFSPQQAADPQTSMQDMARIAAERPDLWASLATNPSLYPDLREWLGKVDDPAVKEALKASEQQASPVPAPAAADAPPPPPPPPASAPPPPPPASASGSPSAPVAADAAHAPMPAPATPSPATGAPPGPEPAGTMAPAPSPSAAAMAPTAVVSPQPSAAAGPAPAPAGRRRRRRGWVIAAVLVLVLAVSGSAFAIYSYFFQRGASSPDGVMDSIAEAIPGKDILSLGKMVSPEEIDTVTKSADVIKDGGSGSGERSSKGDPGSLFSEDAVDSYLESVTVSSSEMRYSVDQKSDDLAIATISSWRLNARVDQSLASTLRTRYESAKGSTLNQKEKDFFDDLDFSDATYNDDVSRDFFSGDIPLELVLVREDGRWYVSPMMTWAQWEYQKAASRDDDVKTPDYRADFEAEGAHSPEEAVRDLTQSVLDARRPSDLFDKDVTGLLSLPERRLARVYGPVTVGDDRKYSSRLSEHAQIDWDLSSTDIGDGRAVVRPGKSRITVFPGEEDKEFTLSFDGDTMNVKTSASRHNTASVNISRQLANPERLGVVVENRHGGWHVSTSGTIVNVFSLQPSERALDDLSRILEDAGMSPKDASDLADAVTRSSAVATPVLVAADIIGQLKDVEWRGHSYSDRDSGSTGGSYYYGQCSRGDMVACDLLYATASGYEGSYGQSCGGRNYSLKYGGQCETLYGKHY